MYEMISLDNGSTLYYGFFSLPLVWLNRPIYKPVVFESKNSQLFIFFCRNIESLLFLRSNIESFLLFFLQISRFYAKISYLILLSYIGRFFVISNCQNIDSLLFLRSKIDSFLLFSLQISTFLSKMTQLFFVIYKSLFVIFFYQNTESSLFHRSNTDFFCYFSSKYRYYQSNIQRQNIESISLQFSSKYGLFLSKMLQIWSFIYLSHFSRCLIFFFLSKHRASIVSSVKYRLFFCYFPPYIAFSGQICQNIAFFWQKC